MRGVNGVDLVARQVERQLSPEKAEAILQGAMQEFLRRGYAGTSMDRVAAAAGVSKATVYSHFQDKEGVFTALVQRLAQEKISFIQDEQFLAMPIRQALTMILTRGLGQMERDEQHLPFIRLIIGESGRFPELAQIFVRNLHKPGLERITQFLDQHPDLQLEDPEAIARIALGAMVHFMLIQHVLHGQEILPMERDRLIKSLVDLVCGPDL
jgi:AcrR family transcriptional regulator